jgi:hypothetical protein
MDVVGFLLRGFWGFLRGVIQDLILGKKRKKALPSFFKVQVDKEDFMLLLLTELRHLPCKNDECTVNVVAYLDAQSHHSEYQQNRTL